MFTLGLQCGTTGSAVVTMIPPLTTGLGSRSEAYALHGMAVTMVWLVLLFFSCVAHCDYITPKHGMVTMVARASDLTPSSWPKVSGFYSTCYCNSSVVGRGVQRACNVLIATGHDCHSVEVAWTWSLSSMRGVWFFLGLICSNRLMIFNTR